jgi:5-methylcytosine-specific restriction endonuclease McrA
VRRSNAVGRLARQQTALDLAGVTGDVETATDSASAPKLPPAREVVLHLHLSAAAVGAGGFLIDPTGRLEEGQRLVLRDQVQGWCGDTHTTVTVKPVTDLNARLHTDAYEVPDPIREQVTLRDGTCVFPWCTRPARRCQVDHVIPYDHEAAAEGRPQPGPTASDNLAALCTFHHRLKTHSAWTYKTVEPGVYEWTSPHGHRYRRDPDGGTTRLDDDSGPPAVPRPRLPRLLRP